jgi:hypothetical protein
MPVGVDELTLLQLPARVARLTTGVIDDRARAAFTEGQCHALAIATHDRTGWGIELLIEAAPTSRWRKRERYGIEDRWVHAVNRCPDGKLLDIHGRQSEDELLERWGGSDRVTLRPVDRETLLELHRHGSGVAPDLEGAGPFAETLLTNLG